MCIMLFEQFNLLRARPYLIGLDGMAGGHAMEGVGQGSYLLESDAWRVIMRWKGEAQRRTGSRLLRSRATEQALAMARTLRLKKENQLF